MDPGAKPEMMGEQGWTPAYPHHTLARRHNQSSKIEHFFIDHFDPS
jgi:hypothetical protein